MRILSIANQKGGVGKTTTAVNLATALAATNRKILLIDFDPQKNASTAFGLLNVSKKNNVYQVLHNPASVQDVIVKTFIPNLHIIPSHRDLYAAEIELFNLDQKEYKLTETLQFLKNAYTDIIIDCPPGLGLLSLNALVASHRIIIPIQCEYYALEGLSQIFNTISLVKKNFNDKLEIDGLLLTMYDKRSSLAQLVEKEVRDYFGPLVYKTVIPRNVKISEAPSHGKPVLIYDIRCPGSLAYINLVKEMIQKGE